MTMIYNGVEVKNIIYNGTDLDKVIHNGVTVFEKAPSADPVFANNTPEQIQAAVKAGIASTLWKVGDKIPIKLKGTVGSLSLNGTYYAYIIGFDHNKDLESGGKPNLHLQFSRTSSGTNIAFVDSAYQTRKTSGTWFNMNNSATNVGGWKDSRMRTVICPAFYNALPTEWQNVITECTKYTNNTGTVNSTSASDVTATQDKIWLLAEYEAFGVKSGANQYEQNKQKYYSIYPDNSSRIKYKHDATSTTCHWWLRSLTMTHSDSFLSVNTEGKLYTYYYANASRGFAPCFQIS